MLPINRALVANQAGAARIGRRQRHALQVPEHIKRMRRILRQRIRAAQRAQELAGENEPQGNNNEPPIDQLQDEDLQPREGDPQPQDGGPQHQEGDDPLLRDDDEQLREEERQPPVDDQQPRVRGRPAPPNRVAQRTDQGEPETGPVPSRVATARTSPETPRPSGLNEPSSPWFSPSTTLTSPSSLGWTPLVSRSPAIRPAVHTTKDSSLKAIKPFNQRRMSPKYWLSMFEAAAEANELIDYEIVMAFISKMPDDAQAWAYANSSLAYQDLREAFLNRFGSDLLSVEIRERVNDFKQSRGTRPSAFYYEMAAMNRLAEDTFTDNEIRSKFLDNLLPELRNWTRTVYRKRMKWPIETLLEKLDQKAEMLGLCQGWFNSSTTTTTTTTTTNNRNVVAAVTQDEHQSTMARQLMDALNMHDHHGSSVFVISNDRGRWDRSQSSNQQNRGSNASNQQDRSFSQTNRPPLTGSKRPRSEITCFYCADKGHYQNECPIRSRAQEIAQSIKRQRTVPMSADGSRGAPLNQRLQPQPVAMVDSAQQPAQPAQDQPTHASQQSNGTSPTSVLLVNDIDEQATDVMMAIEPMSTTPISNWQPLRIRVSINNQPVEAIFDTGSGHTLMNESLMARLGCRIVDRYSGRQLRNASNGPMSVRGITRFRMTMNHDDDNDIGAADEAYLVEALVMVDLGPQLLLGLDSIHAMGGELDLKSMTFKPRAGRRVQLLARGTDDVSPRSQPTHQLPSLVDEGRESDCECAIGTSIWSAQALMAEHEEITAGNLTHHQRLVHHLDSRTTGNGDDYDDDDDDDDDACDMNDDVTMTMTVMAQRMLSANNDDIDQADLHTIMTSESDEVCVVSTIDDLTIPPQHASTLRVSVKNAPDRCTGLILPDLDTALKHNGFLRRSEVTVEHGQATTVIMNLNQSHECRIRAGTPLAVFAVTSEISPIEEITTTANKTTVTKCTKGDVDFEADLEKATSPTSLNDEQHHRLKELIRKYRKAFATNSLRVTCTTRIEHRIETRNAAPIRCRPHRCSQAERDQINEMVTTLLENGQIVPSTSEWCAPIVLVTKSDGSKRMCIDYRRLNAVTEKRVAAIPRLDDTFDALASSSIFSTLDLASGYWQVPMNAESESKTAFITPDNKVYQWKVMPFGLVNSGATFMELMNDVLSSCINKFAQCYVDDIAIHSQSYSQHLEHISTVLELLIQAGLQVRLSKCRFAQGSLPFLGHVISAGSVRPNPSKVEAIKSFPRPTDRAALLRFNGMANFYRRFINNFATIAKPLTELTSSEIKFEWHQEHEQAFCTIKNALVTAPVLALPNMNLPFTVKCDASGIGVGAVLTQPDRDGQEHPVAFFSKKLNNAERRYSTTEQECLAVIRALKEWRPYRHDIPGVHRPSCLAVSRQQRTHCLGSTCSMDHDSLRVRHGQYRVSEEVAECRGRRSLTSTDRSTT